MDSDEFASSQRLYSVRRSDGRAVRTVRECVVHLNHALAGTRLPTALSRRYGGTQ